MVILIQIAVTMVMDVQFILKCSFNRGAFLGANFIIMWGVKMMTFLVEPNVNLENMGPDICGLDECKGDYGP